MLKLDPAKRMDIHHNARSVFQPWLSSYVTSIPEMGWCLDALNEFKLPNLPGIDAVSVTSQYPEDGG